MNNFKTLCKHLTFLILLATISCKNKTEASLKIKEATVEKLKVLIIDGDNNHGIWPKTTMMMKYYLEETALFEVAIYRGAYTYQGPHHGKVAGIDTITQLLTKYPLQNGQKTQMVEEHTYDPNFKPEWDAYDVVVSNLGSEAFSWPDVTKRSFEKYMENGGGLVVVHGANNSFGAWDNFNKMIGIGGWGDRPHKGQFQLYYDNDKLVRAPSDGAESSHGPEVEFVLTTRAPTHPIMQGLPRKWRHTKDELYDRLRGPAENITVLATSFSDVEGNAQPWALENKGSGREEPLLMTITYGKGRIFQTALGHMDFSMESVGFITTFQRGVEWAATGTVTQKIPDDFPSEETSSRRLWSLE